ncbi:MAG: hypothetical protein JNK87_29035 [Bryobacterales bacterium]|nr:hypothetical protein [Bryobacterales bacterium]
MPVPLRPIPGLIRSLKRRAFVDPRPEVKLRYLCEGVWCEAVPALAAHDLAVLLPTLASQRLPFCLPGLLAALRSLCQNGEGLRLLLVVAAQDRHGEQLRDRYLEQVTARLAEGLNPASVTVVGLSVSVPSKVLAINATLPLLDAAAVAAVAWFDDDIEIHPDCLLELWRAYDPTFEGLYGARKLAVRDASGFSDWWAGVKNSREPANRYPHGCAMLLARRALGDGIPLEYITDDHYFLFRYLAPERPDYLHWLRVVPAALVRVPMANSAQVTFRRFGRNFRNLQRVLADVSPEVERCFLRNLHFPGVRLPRQAPEAVSLRYWMRLAFYGGKYLYWKYAEASILLRGLAGRPRRTVWYSSPPPGGSSGA